MVEKSGIADTPSGSSTPSGSTPGQRRLNRAADFPVGKVVFKNFKILKKLGAGGMGAVYQVTNLLLQKTVALKVLPVGYITEAELLRFQNEARAAGRLAHRNIASTFDLAIDQKGVPYLSMEFVSGPTLKQVLEQRGPLGLNDFLDTFIPLCSALAHAHSKEVVHRDLKPANIIIGLEEDGRLRPVLVDFGVAKLIDADGYLTQAGACIGTPLYVSPEQTMGKPGSGKSDMYSIGCVMFHALAGYPPFEGENALETLMLHRDKETPVDELYRIERVPDELVKLIERLMAKNPDDRPESFSEIGAVLEGIVPQLSPAEAQLESESEESGGLREWAATAAMEPSSNSVRWGKIVVVAIAVFLVPPVVLSISKLNTESGPVPDRKQLKSQQIAQERKPTWSIQDSGVREQIRAQIESGSPNLNLACLRLRDDDMSLFESCDEACRIEFLDLSDNDDLTDHGLQFLEKLNPKSLKLARTKAKTLSYLRNMTNLERLDLSNTPIEDEDLQALSKLKNLFWLELNNTRISDRGLRELAALEKLGQVDLAECKISDKAIANLRSQLPKLKVETLEKALLTMMRSANRAQKEGELEEARLKYLRILNRMQETGTKDNSYATNVYIGLGQTAPTSEEAGKCLVDALPFAKNQTTKLRLAGAMNRHAKRLLQEKSLAEGLKFAGIAQRLYVEGNAATSPNAIDTSLLISQFLGRQNKLKQAEDSAKATLALLAKAKKKEPLHEPFAILARAEIEQAQGRYSEARRNYRKAIHLFETEVMEPTSLAGALQGLSFTEEKLGNLGQAKSSCDKALAIAKQYKINPEYVKGIQARSAALNAGK